MALQAREINAWHRRCAVVVGAVTALAVVATTATDEFRPWLLPIWMGGMVGAYGLLLAFRGTKDRRWLLVWPIAIQLCVLGTALVAPRAATLTLGLITVCFLLIGLTQRPRTSLPMLVPAIAVYVGAVHQSGPQLVIRLLLALFIWTCVAEIPAALTHGLRQARGELARLSLTDALTQLYNRRGWETHLAELSEAAARAGRGFAVILLDLDHFKAYNDTHGHLRGDDLLQNVARMLQQVAGPGNLVARWGGEEFAVALPGADLATSRLIAERILAAMPEGQSCSAGLAEFRPGDDPRTLVDRADAALYEAKRFGRNRVIPEAQPA